ncbi:hypothetical protein KR084_007128 [Drosophila pseudotakahashii]|nr:hypothetical protein KR084_007128 [Drosophila pseudotakahashii]
MPKVTNILVILLICLSLTKGTNYPKLEFLGKLINILREYRAIETTVIIQHSQNKNCSLQHWNPPGSSILRANELTSIKVRGYCNDQSVTLVCMDPESDLDLLRVVADVLDNTRQERIILWSQREPKRQFLAHISQLAVKFKFTQIIMLAMADNLEEKLSFYRLNAYPTPQFIQVTNVSNINGPVFFKPDLKYNYLGMTAILKESTDSNIGYKINTTNGHFSISDIEDLEIIEFANRYNLTLRSYDENDTEAEHFDIQLGKRFITRSAPTQMDFINPSTATSLMVIVPCSQEWRFVDVLKKLGVLKLLLCLLAVYVAFVFVETLILWLTYRMSGDARRLTSLNPLLNTRAFQAILGLPFPELRRSSLSLRQLSLGISIFGFICSNFISCKLSSMLMKPVQNAQAKNFEELRASGLITVTDEYTRNFIENDIYPKFFHEVIPNFYIMENLERNKLITSLNDSFSFTMLSTIWPTLDSYQRSFGGRVYCASDDLTIAWNIPRMYALGNNSIFKWMLTRFMIFFHESGIPNLWIKRVPIFYRQLYNLTMLRRFESGAVPLSIKHLSWLWHLLILGHSIATVVFIVEIFLSKRNKFRKNLRRRSSGEHDLV